MSVSRATQIVVAVSALLAGLWIDPPRAVACSCASPQGDAEAFAQADAVFVGDLVERRSDDRIWDTDPSVRLIFAVDTVYKGEVFERQSVVTAENGAACGLELTERGPGPYVVFARTTSGDGLDDPVPGELTANLCGGSRPLAESAPPFDVRGPPQAGSSPIGGGGWWPPTRTNAIVGGFAFIAALVLIAGFRRREPR